MRISGLQLERIGHGRVKPFSYVLYALMYPAVALDTRLRLIWRERKPALRELNRELARWMLDRRVLTEDNLILMAQKTLAHKAIQENPAASSSAAASCAGSSPASNESRPASRAGVR